MGRHSKITLCDYLAEKVPNECYDVLMSSGYEFDMPRSKKELSSLLSQYVAKDKESALKKLAEIHPDKDLCQSIDRPVMERDFTSRANMEEGYANPFNRQYYATPYGNMMGFHGVPMTHFGACGCGGSTSFSGYNNCNGDSECGCCKSKRHHSADGEGSSSKNLLYLLLGAGFVWFMINLDNKRQYK